MIGGFAGGIVYIKSRNLYLTGFTTFSLSSLSEMTIAKATYGDKYEMDNLDIIMYSLEKGIEGVLIAWLCANLPEIEGINIGIGNAKGQYLSGFYSGEMTTEDIIAGIKSGVIADWATDVYLGIKRYLEEEL